MKKICLLLLAAAPILSLGCAHDDHDDDMNRREYHRSESTTQSREMKSDPMSPMAPLDSNSSSSSQRETHSHEEQTTIEKK